MRNTRSTQDDDGPEPEWLRKLTPEERVRNDLFAAALDLLALSTHRDKWAAFEPKARAYAKFLAACATGDERKLVKQLTAFIFAKEAALRAPWRVVRSRVLAAERVGYPPDAVDAEATVAIFLALRVGKDAPAGFVEERLLRARKRLRKLPPDHPLRKHGLPETLEKRISDVAVARRR